MAGAYVDQSFANKRILTKRAGAAALDDQSRRPLRTRVNAADGAEQSDPTWLTHTLATGRDWLQC
jgi:hypothetical protein